MPTVVSHAIAGAALATALRPPGPWGHLLGHRAITHSLAFAAALAAVVVGLAFRGPRWRETRGARWLTLFVATASHGGLDALTDGGSGIACLAPFDDTRYFAPWQPIRVSPISLSRFLSERGLRVLQSEMVWVWLPSAILLLGAVLARGRAGRSR